jgi:clan AA aspartic protease
MIIGTVENREALVELEVTNAVQSIATTAAIDTGYNGYLTLPSDLITALGLNFAGYRSGTLADGSTVILAVHLGTVTWHEVQREVLVAQAVGRPLIGMSLLQGSRLTIDAIERGDVVIEKLPLTPPESQLKADRHP